MREVCFCGRSGNLEDRRAVLSVDLKMGLECPQCGDVDTMSYLPYDQAMDLWMKAKGEHS